MNGRLIHRARRIFSLAVCAGLLFGAASCNNAVEGGSGSMSNVSGNVDISVGGDNSMNVSSGKNGSKPHSGSSSKAGGGSVTVPTSVKVGAPNPPPSSLSVQLTDRLFKAQTYEWARADMANFVDFCDDSKSAKEAYGVKLASTAAVQGQIGLTDWIEATTSDAYLVYNTPDLAGLYLELYATSDPSAKVSVFAGTGAGYMKLATRVLSTEPLSGGYSRYTVTLRDVPKPGFTLVKIMMSPGVILGKVAIDGFDETQTAAPYAAQYATHGGLKVKNGVYSLSGTAVSSLTLYREGLRGARFTIRYKGEPPKISLQSSDEDNVYNDTRWLAQQQADQDGYHVCTVFTTDKFDAAMNFVRLAVQKSDGQPLEIISAKICAPKLFDKVASFDRMYDYSTNIKISKRKGSTGAVLADSGEGFLIYNKNDIKSFDIKLLYNDRGTVQVYTSPDAKTWKKASVKSCDIYNDGSYTAEHLRNSAAIPAGTNYLKIVLSAQSSGSYFVGSIVSEVYIDGVCDTVREIQRICEQQGVKFKDILSVTHAAGRYHFTDDNYVKEGVDTIAGMGCEMVNLNMHMPSFSSDFSFNADWNKNRPKTLKELAQSPYFKSAFSNPKIKRFSLIALDSYTWISTNTSDNDRKIYCDIEYEAVYDLADYLLKEYNGTGKTFIIQTWESDAWLVASSVGNNATYNMDSVRNYRDWITARQNAVNAARAANPGSDVKLYNCMEISTVATKGKLLTDVIPATRCDLYAYSVWENLVYGYSLDANLKLFKSYVPASGTVGSKNYYVGEYGMPEMNYGRERTYGFNVQSTKIMLNNGYRYINFWQIYCNEQTSGEKGSHNNEDMRGFWLIRADGTKTPLYNLFKMLLTR